MIFLENTLTRKKEEFKPIKNGEVSIYHCGPTVYWVQHIGNMRAVVFADLLRRMFELNKYKVTFVRNYTDVGHLTGDNIGDADSGEDRMEKASKRENKTPDEIANKYIEIYKKDIKLLNVLPPTHTPRATENIKEMLEMVLKLLKNGNAYQTDLAVYFDVSTFPDYTKLSNQKLQNLVAGAGFGTVEDPNKKNPNDFSLWFFKAGTHKNALQTWPSPFNSPLVENGLGFPGWHIECSAMSKRFLGNHFDIHLGGVEHIPVHHTNEIAQSVCANHSPFVNYWLHNEHLLYENGKMSKSGGTAFSVGELIEKGFDPLSLRYFFLQTNYRSKQNFTWQALEASQTAYKRLKTFVLNSKKESFVTKIVDSFIPNEKEKEYKKRFLEYINDNLNTAEALALSWTVLKDEELSLYQRGKLLTLFDKLFGLDLDKDDTKNKEDSIPENVLELIKQRKNARANKDWKKADELRGEISKLGFEIKDEGDKTVVIKK
jgi:cysteinyl-tRNA synthetase